MTQRSPFSVRPAACEGCPANARAHGFVPPSGRADARIAILGQGPGQDEVWQRVPFIGKSGARLNSWLAGAGLRRTDTTIANVTWCGMTKDGVTQPWKDVTPPKAAIEHCRRAHWGPWLESLTGLEVIVAVGVPAMSALMPGASARSAGQVRTITIGERGEHHVNVTTADAQPGGARACTQTSSDPLGGGPSDEGTVAGPPSSTGASRGAGGPHELLAAVEAGGPHDTGRLGEGGGVARSDLRAAPDGLGGDGPGSVDVEPAPRARSVRVVGILHPAYILRGQFSQEPYQVGHLRKVRAMLDGTYVEPLDVREPPPGARLWPTVPEILDYLTHVRSASLDIEWAGPHVVMVGLWGRREYAGAGGLTIRFRIDGRPNDGWTYAEWLTVVRALWVWLASPLVTKSMQNGQSSDVWMLERLGFRVEGYDFDTMLAMHIGDPERVKALESMAVSLASIPHWKWLAKGETDIEGK